MSTLCENTDTRQLGGKYLTFALGVEEYGLPILNVREIIGQMETTSVPRAPKYMKGVINLRGQVIAVIDLRSRFAMPPVPRTQETCVIVVETDGPDGRKVSTGIIVDRVSEVLSVASDDIEEPPSFGDTAESQFVLGLGKIGKSVKILLDIEKVLAHGIE